MTPDEICKILFPTLDNTVNMGFLNFLSNRIPLLRKEYLDRQLAMAQDEIKKWEIKVPNSMEGRPYYHLEVIPTLNLPGLNDVQIFISAIEGDPIDKIGIKAEIAEDGKSFILSGTPNLDCYRKEGVTSVDTEYIITIHYHFSGIDPVYDPKIYFIQTRIIINQDPRKLWINKPVDWDNMPEPKYETPNEDKKFVKGEVLEEGIPLKDMVAASKRGRSHAREATPRDDNFRLFYDEKNQWYIMAVADGAGSAPFSRMGSRIACDTVIEHCREELKNPVSFEDNINLYNLYKSSKEGDEAGQMISTDIWRIVGHAAHKAQKAIFEQARKDGFPNKKYATTLLLAICKRFDFGWFIASFWVGDGAICLFDQENHESYLLGTPDEGEYGGQTRFLTMPEIFADSNNIIKRLNCRIVKDFTALFLMTDGVSDPKFETDSNLNDPQKWADLWNDLLHNEEHPVNLQARNKETAQQLLDWLDFWSKGNHDDRTIAILY
jgi:serine/threonine protein phosphatase PrpC